MCPQTGLMQAVRDICGMVFLNWSMLSQGQMQLSMESVDLWRDLTGRIERDEIDCIVHIGDNVYNDTDYCDIWEYAVHERLNVEPQDHAVLLTEPPHNPKPDRVEMVEIMFHTFGVESLNISIQGVLYLSRSWQVHGTRAR